MNRISKVLGAGCLLMLLSDLPAVAQFGRYPGVPGYPGGRNGTSLPPVVPGGGREHKDKRDKQDEAPLPDFTGTVRDISKNKLILKREDSNEMEFLVSKKTRFYEGSRKVKSSALKPGDRVSVEARHAPDGSMEAVNVRLEQQPKSSS